MNNFQFGAGLGVGSEKGTAVDVFGVAQHIFQGGIGAGEVLGRPTGEAVPVVVKVTLSTPGIRVPTRPQGAGIGFVLIGDIDIKTFF